ncbi:GNAT family N-acetyltransferase [Rapidithrix thailandica]|uniref:GNAT family N-acetyltransferase n=1 Tax=Rapidithrix thailandica TaxID=413964 RepID=A0AAW9SCU2_9BACT
MNFPILETERLRLRMWKEEDFEAYADICADPQVMQYLGKGQTLSRPEAWRHMAFLAGHWHLRGFGHWALEEKENRRLVGRLGFLQPEGWPGFEIGWTLARSVWGKGYATEGAKCALQYAFDEMGKEHVISLIHPDNAASVKVAQRLGESFEQEVEITGIPVMVYGLWKAQWVKQQG